MKLKTYVITVSRNFQKAHPRAGEPTEFVEKIIAKSKIHTIRDNFELWEKRFKEVQQGKAMLSVRYWTDKPYRSKQAEIILLTSAHGIGIQRLDCDNPFAWEIDNKPLNYQPEMIELAKNDGLEYKDFDAWFDIENATGTKAIIHFTPFRY